MGSKPNRELKDNYILIHVNDDNYRNSLNYAFLTCKAFGRQHIIQIICAKGGGEMHK
jgi:hypothetical protein